MRSALCCFTPSTSRKRPRLQKVTVEQSNSAQDKEKTNNNKVKIMTALHTFVSSMSPRSSVDRGQDKDEHVRAASTNGSRLGRFGLGDDHTRESSASSASGKASGKASRRTEERRARKEEKVIRLQQERESIDERRKLEDQLAMMEEDEETQARYGWVTEAKELLSLHEVTERKEGDEVTFRARIHHQRNVSKHMDFLLFRDQTDSIQGVLQHDTPHFVKWVQRLEPESLVQVTGFLQNPPEPVRSATYKNLEVKVHSVHLVNPARDLGFDNYDPPETTQQRLSNRILDLRHPANQALFRIRSMVTRVFRDVLERDHFIEIQTPKLQPAATESGAEVFKVNYFGRRAFLAQSPQLAKQMTISADFGRVYEVSGYVFCSGLPPHKHCLLANYCPLPDWPRFPRGELEHKATSCRIYRSRHRNGNPERSPRSHSSSRRFLKRGIP